MAAKKRRNPALKGISRVDSGPTHGWLVRAYRNGKTYGRLFSDLKHGGKRKALNLAKEYRDDLMEKLSGLPEKRKSRAGRGSKYVSGDRLRRELGISNK